MRPKQVEIAKLIRSTDGSFEIMFAVGSTAKSATFTMDDGAKLKIKQPRGLYKASRRIIGLSIMG